MRLEGFFYDNSSGVIEILLDKDMLHEVTPTFLSGLPDFTGIYKDKIYVDGRFRGTYDEHKMTYKKLATPVETIDTGTSVVPIENRTAKYKYDPIKGEISLNPDFLDDFPGVVL